MKKSLLSNLALAALLVSFTSCKDKAEGNNTTGTTEEPTEEVVITEQEEIIEVTEEGADASEDIVVDDDTEVTTNDSETESTSTYDESDSATAHDEETVEVTYSYTVMGKVVKGSKSFSGDQDEVEDAVEKFGDSLTQIDPNIKITVK